VSRALGVVSDAIVLTRMPSGASSTASDRLKLVRPAFAPAYTAYIGAPRWASIVVKLMMLPPRPAARIRVTARLVDRIAQPKFRWICSAQSSQLVAVFHMRVNKQRCFETCTDYIVVWSLPNLNNWPSPCSAGSTMPKFFSGQYYQVDLTTKNGAWVGTLTGALAGPGSGPTTCTFMLEDKALVAVGKWIEDHPKVVGFVELAVVIAVVVAVAVVTMGAAAAEEAALVAEASEQGGPDVANLVE